MKRYWISLSLFAILCASACAQALPPHPRLILTRELTASMRQAKRTDPLFRALERRLVERGRLYESQSPPRYDIKPPDSLLEESRKALAHLTTFSLLYRLDGDPQWLQHARSEMLAIAAFPNWSPLHFLDTAEMTTAMAFAFDWLYDDLSEAERQTVRKAIIVKGLTAGLEEYRVKRWWTSAPHNWNLVCNGGMIIGALAVGEDEAANEVLAKARTLVRLPMTRFAPEGGWAEGPMYWAYATRYAVWMMACMDSALGTDDGLSQSAGFAQTGLFALYSDGPCHQNFNFADAEDGLSVTPQLLWLAQLSRSPVLAWEQNQRGNSVSAFDVIWYQDQETPTHARLPLDRWFRGVNVGFFRSAWEDPNALFLGFKGGENLVNHSHLDLGSFVLQDQGQIWALDLGPDDYDLPGYFDVLGARYHYYRLSTQGHNTLNFGGLNQRISGTASLRAFGSRPERAFAVLDLSAAYAHQALKVERGFALLNRRRVVIQDEFTAQQPLDYSSGFLTRAQIALDGSHAILCQGGKTFQVRVVEPPGVTLEIVSAKPSNPKENSNAGVQKLVARLPAISHATVTWEFWAGSAVAPPGAVLPLAQWGKGNPSEP